MEEEKVFCIYKGKYILKSESSIEHIIPTSLGGSDDFVILVDRNFNSLMGSTVDADMANDFIVRLDTLKNDYQGHSKKKPVLKIKKAKIGDTPVSVHFKKEGMEVYNPIEKRYVKESAKIEMQTSINLDTRLKFVAKVALATGYFAYKELFVNFADHDTLRKFILTKDPLNEKFEGLRFYDSFSEVKEKDNGQHAVIQFLIEALGGSTVIIGFAENRMIISVGIAGKYIGTINFKAQTSQFPMDDENRLGKVFQCVDNQLRVGSFWSAIYQLNKEFKLVNIDDKDLDL